MFWVHSLLRTTCSSVRRCRGRALNPKVQRRTGHPPRLLLLARKYDSRTGRHAHRILPKRSRRGAACSQSASRAPARSDTREGDKHASTPPGAVIGSGKASVLRQESLRDWQEPQLGSQKRPRGSSSQRPHPEGSVCLCRLSRRAMRPRLVDEPVFSALCAVFASHDRLRIWCPGSPLRSEEQMPARQSQAYRLDGTSAWTKMQYIRAQI